MAAIVGHRLLHGRGTKCFLLLFERIGRVGVGHVNVPIVSYTHAR